MAGKKDEVATKGSSAVAVHDYGADAGAGFEGTGAEDIIIPFLGVLQGLSPQLQTLEGAKVGMLHNSVTDELTPGDKGLVFIPGYREHCYVEWVPRKQGGGFVARHEPTSDVVTRARQEAKEQGLKFGQYFVPTESGGKNELKETFYLYGITVQGEGEDATIAPVCIAFTSTKIKVYRKWMTAVRLFDPKSKIPIFAYQLRIKTTTEKNNEGEFANFVITPEGGSLEGCLLPPDSGLLAAAKQVKESVEQGSAKIDEAKASPDPAGDAEAPF